MKTNNLFTRFSVLLICLSLLSCHNDLYTTSDFLVRVDSIKAPDSVSYGIPFEIDFFGVIGFNGCYSFKTFNTVYWDKEIVIEAWGSSDFTRGLCTDELVSLDWYKLNTTISSPGTYRIIIKEPDNFTLVRQITVN